MPINIQNDSLFKVGYSLKYITVWDNLFKRNKYSGALFFYGGHPFYIVDVQIQADRDKLEEEDILITVSSHNSSDIDKKIKEKTNSIYELCKSSIIGGFVLDIENMKVLEPEDFIYSSPVKGLHTLFMFENIKDSIYSISNPTQGVNDIEFYTWLISYIYSYTVCLSSRNEPDDYSKKFLQAISTLSYFKGSSVYIHDRSSIIDCELSDLGEKLLPIPGENTKRFEQLVEKSLNQMNKSHKKEKNK